MDGGLVVIICDIGIIENGCLIQLIFPVQPICRISIIACASTQLQSGVQTSSVGGAFVAK